MVDAYMSLTGNASGSLSGISLDETLSNGTFLSLTKQGTATATFLPVNALTATKDQDNFAFNGSTATSQIVDAFSVTGGSIPEPGTIALFGAGLLGCALYLGRRRRRGW
jgi:hypothetical protein